MIQVQRNSILTRLTMMNMLVSMVALLLACAGFFAYDQVTFRDSLLRTLSAQAQIIGSNSISALLFNDPQSAANTLAALKSSTNIASAGILTPDGRPFADFTRQKGDEILNVPTLAADETEAHWIRSTHVVLMRRIVSDGKLVGFVYLRADLDEIDQRLKQYTAIAIAVLLVSFFMAMLVSSAFRNSVARPVIQLAGTARAVSRGRDYAVRARSSGAPDELNVLINAFNDMLAQIQSRDAALQKAHNELEQRVQDRTRELVSANRELEAFSYSVSHDLRGPIDALNGFSYVLLKQYAEKLDPQGRELIEFIRASGKRMLELIDDLLNLSRLTTSAMHLEPVNLSAVARTVTDELRRLHPERNVSLLIADVPPAQGDARLLRIVLENLLRNSWKYTSIHPSARIEFGSSEKDERRVYFVRDDGVGFDPRSANRLFHPFQRLHSPAEFPGSGIGLATVQRIIHRHGGEIWAEAAPGKGATFYFTLGIPPSGVDTERTVPQVQNA